MKLAEVIEKYKPKEYYMVDYLYGISQNAVAKIMEEEESYEKVSLDAPEHPANQELLPELDAFNQAKARENLLKFYSRLESLDISSGNVLTYINLAIDNGLLNPALANFNLEKLANALVSKRDLQFKYLLEHAGFVKSQ